MSERILLASESVEDVAIQAADVLRQGGVVLYPTDTLYALGADALNQQALEKIYTIKGRPDGKPVHSIVPDIDAAEVYADVTPLARELAKKYLPGALTLILKKKPTVPTWATEGLDTFGFRVPNNDFCLALAREFGQPFTATSANVSGGATGSTVDAILEQLGERADAISLVVDAGELTPSLPSTVVDAWGSVPVVLRLGAVADI